MAGICMRYTGCCLLIGTSEPVENSIPFLKTKGKGVVNLYCSCKLVEMQYE